jgi:RNA polymerase sigma factor (sigma-70 family)
MNVSSPKTTPAPGSGGQQSDAARRELALLAAQAQGGDRRAFEALAVLYREKIYRLAYFRLRNANDAADIAQDAFVAALRKISTLKEPEKFAAWLYRLALNKIRDHQRWMRLREFFGSDVEDAGAAIPSERDGAGAGLARVREREFWRFVGALLQTLSAAERDVFALRFVEDLAIKDIALVLGKSQSAVKTHLSRGLAKFRQDTRLRELLDSYHEDGP